MGAGRPSEYDPTYPEKLLEYFKDEGRFPTIEGFCAKHLISRQSFHRWVKEHQELSDTYESAKQLQKDRLVIGALDRTYDSSFSKFLAINCMGMRESQDVNVGGQPENPVKVDATIQILPVKPNADSAT